jgi:hypothetical protein
MRRLAVVIAIASLSGLSPPKAALPDGKAEFLRWANEIARGKKLLICRAGQLRYPGEEAGYFAALGDPKLDVPLVSSSNQIVLLSNGKKHWRYAQTALTVHVGCGIPAPWEEIDTLTIHAQDLATKWLWDEEDVTFVGEEPVMLQEVHSDIDGDTTVDWLKATEESHDGNWDGAPPGKSREGRHGILVALPTDSRWIKSWKTPTFVPFGEKNRTGPADADLAAYALDLNRAGIRIVVDVTDDRAVPTPAKADAWALVRSDHLELWWVPRDSSEAKQLGIGMRADGSAAVRWLMPAASTEKVPEVRRTGSHFEIDLSLATLGLDANKPDSDRNLPFTVAFSDSDETGAKQQTVIATSPVRWNRRETFGELILLPSNSRRFPSFGDPM